MNYSHIPVMLKEVLELLQPQPGQQFIDGTLGGGGYTQALAEAVGPTGRIIAIDLDQLALDHAETIIKEHGLGNITLVLDNFANLSAIAEKQGLTQINGVVLDLGLSSAQLADEQRGFSFQTDRPLNMAFGADEGKTQIIVNKYPEAVLADLIKSYGEERYARRIAWSIVKARQLQPLTTTGQLVEAIRTAVPAAYQHDRIHFATRTFQALRLATNQELANLETVLPQALELLAPQGRLAVVSFHSLEDRLVKKFFKTESQDCLCPPQWPVCQCGHQASLEIITKKPLTPSEAEIANNPRARSAKLRVAVKK